jgi:hypothetical protein
MDRCFCDARDRIGIPAAIATDEEPAAGAVPERGPDPIQAKVTLARSGPRQLDALPAAFAKAGN